MIYCTRLHKNKIKNEDKRRKLPSICKKKIHKINIFVSPITTLTTWQVLRNISLSTFVSTFVFRWNLKQMKWKKQHNSKLMWITNETVVATVKSTRIMTSWRNMLRLNMKLGHYLCMNVSVQYLFASMRAHSSISFFLLVDYSSIHDFMFVCLISNRERI